MSKEFEVRDTVHPGGKRLTREIRMTKASDNLVERLRNDEVRQTFADGPDPLCAEAATRIEKLQAALLEIATWAEAYPVEIFPEPDLEGVKQVLIANDMMREMDRMHSSWARHLVSGIGGIARAALINTHDGRDA
jgi:hypothetical protein